MSYQNLNNVKLSNSQLHIKKIITEIQNNESSFEKFEETSIFLKRKEEKLKKKEENKVIDSGECQINDFNEVKTVLFKKISKPPLKKLLFKCEDVIEKGQFLKFAGFDLTLIELLKIKTYINENFTGNDVKDVIFFGKIFGIKSDYYIIRVLYNLELFNNTKYSSSATHEPTYIEGANKYIFYFSDNSFTKWIELPLITYEQLRISRLFKYAFTGDPNSYVKSFFPFPGKEIHLLKCIILRIMHSTFIVPDGLYEIKSIDNSADVYGIDLTDKICQIKEDFQIQEMTSNEEYTAYEKWVHEFSYIYDNGRIVNIVNEENPVPRLQSIVNDKPIGESLPLWNIKEIGDRMIYTNDTGQCQYNLIKISNNNWNGSVTVFMKGKYYSFYIGYGYKSNGNLYFPLEPLQIESDPLGLTEYKEPNPDKDPEIIESDSDVEPVDENENKNEDE